VTQALSPADIVRSGLCIGCGGCASREPEDRAAVRFDLYGQLKPTGDRDFLRRRTEGFARTCPFSPAAPNEDAIAAERLTDAPQIDDRLGRFTAAFVGHAPDVRSGGSSGGLVTWAALALLRSGRIDAVAHVTGDGRPGVDEPMFAYRLSRTEAEIREGAKSRYYPVEMSSVLRRIRDTPGRYAVIGLPCFIKAVHLLRREDPVLRDRIRYTLGLFCGHMKSARLADSYSWQLGLEPKAIHSLDYRIKDETRPANLYTTEAVLPSGESRRRDWWNLADGDWGAGFFQNPACNWCDDVTAETADIAFGDAWAEPWAQDGRGTNVVVARTPELAAMLEAASASGELALEAVDADFTAGTQAAGFRQRREGLAYRLTWSRGGVRPRKRVAPSRDLPAQRKRIYRLRAGLSAWSHRIMWAARRLRWPGLYIAWAHAALATYHGLAYGRGRVGGWVRWWNRLRGRPDAFAQGAA
jgi:coenzyme F420-reducing hydrogenase beta subunit